MTLVMVKCDTVKSACKRTQTGGCLKQRDVKGFKTRRYNIMFSVTNIHHTQLKKLSKVDHTVCSYYLKYIYVQVAKK